MVKASHWYREVTGLNPVEVLTFSGFYRQLFNCVHNCNDHSLLDFTSAVQYRKHFMYHFTKTILLFHIQLFVVVAVFARQCSSRGGELRIHVRPDNRVDIAGQTVIVLQGSLRLWTFGVPCSPEWRCLTYREEIQGWRQLHLKASLWLVKKKASMLLMWFGANRSAALEAVKRITRISFIAKWLSFWNEVYSAFSWQNLAGSIKDVFVPDQSKLSGSFSETICMRHSPQTRGFIRSDEGLTLEKEALFLYGGNSILSCYRYQILMFHLSTDAAPHFL